MEKLSRVKKYEELRKSIETDNNIDKSIHSHTSDEQAKALEKFDSSIFKKVEICDDETYTPEREKKIEEVEELKAPVDDTFTNEYLDDFIREVREYNIKKGNRESENTQADILYQLNATNRAKRSRYIQEIKEDLAEEPEESTKTVLSKEDIAMEVANLLREEAIEEPEAEEFIQPMEEPSPIEEEELYKTRELNIHAMQPVEPDLDREPEVIPEPEEIVEPEPQPVRPAARKVIQPDILDEDPETDEAEEEPEDIFTPKKKGKDAILHKKLLEETQQLRVQMDEYEDELTDLSDGVQKTNKLLNFVLCFLILVLLVIIGFIAYSLWQAGGI